MAVIGEALRRLETALARLEGAVARRIEAEAARGDRDIELALMDEDRARLAAELDAASAQLARTVSVTGDVEQRVARAIEAVEGALDRGAPRGQP